MTQRVESGDTNCKRLESVLRCNSIEKRIDRNIYFKVDPGGRPRQKEADQWKEKQAK